MDLTEEIVCEIKLYVKNQTRPIVCIVGPTACGKTAFAVKLSQLINGELINADSRQIYKEIECITGLDYEEIGDTKNHLFGIKNLDQDFRVAEYLSLVREIIEGIYENKKIPIIVGGTGLFISSLIEGFEIPPRSQDEKFIDSLKYKTNEQLLLELKKLDPQSADDIHVNNRIYLERALEVFQVSGLKKSAGVKNKSKSFDPLIITKKIDSDIDRKKLYERINKRQEFFFEFSLPSIKEILQRDLSLNLQSLRSIGIPEINAFLSGEISKEEAILLMQKKARNYAKRQMTWWRSKKKKFNILEI